MTEFRNIGSECNHASGPAVCPLCRQPCEEGLIHSGAAARGAMNRFLLWLAKHDIAWLYMPLARWWVRR